MIMLAFQLTVKELHTTRTLPKLVRIYEVLYFHNDLNFTADTYSYQLKQTNTKLIPNNSYYYYCLIMNNKLMATNKWKWNFINKHLKSTFVGQKRNLVEGLLQVGKLIQPQIEQNSTHALDEEHCTCQFIYAIHTMHCVINWKPSIDAARWILS